MTFDWATVDFSGVSTAIEAAMPTLIVAVLGAAGFGIVARFVLRLLKRAV